MNDTSLNESASGQLQSTSGAVPHSAGLVPLTPADGAALVFMGLLTFVLIAYLKRLKLMRRGEDEHDEHAS